VKVPDDRVLWGILVFLLIVIIFAGGAIFGLLLGGQGSRAGQPLLGEVALAPNGPSDEGGDQLPIPPDLGEPNVDTSGLAPGETALPPAGDASGSQPSDPGNPAAEGASVAAANATPTNPLQQFASAPTATPKPTATPRQSATPSNGGSNPTDTPDPTTEPTDTPTATPTDTPTATATTAGPAPDPTATPELPPPPSDALDRVNFFRTVAGVSPVTADAGMNDGAQKHAAYMAAHRRISNTEDPADPLYTDEGNRAAQRGNLWLGGGVGMWTQADPVDDWMQSPYHRLWVLYPQAERMGFGLAEDTSTRATGAVLEVFGGWNASLTFPVPLIYPAASQTGVPPTRFGVSLQFPVYTSNPTFTAATWGDQDGFAVPFTRIDPETDPYMRDYGNTIFLLPDSKLAPWTTYTVRVQGTYDSQSFDLEWTFTTGG
jgi:uncharacterized protein YkwD